MNWTKQELEQCLYDSGCSQPLIENCLRLCEEGRDKSLCSELRTYRAALLSELQSREKELDTLDYCLRKLRPR